MGWVVIYDVLCNNVVGAEGGASKLLCVERLSFLDLIELLNPSDMANVAVGDLEQAGAD